MAAVDHFTMSCMHKVSKAMKGVLRISMPWMTLAMLLESVAKAANLMKVVLWMSMVMV